MSITEAQTKQAALAKEIATWHEACCRAAGEAIGHAMKCGDLLLQAKSNCEHGAWQDWVAENFKGSKRTAQTYMRLAKNRATIESKSAEPTALLTIDDAVGMLATPKPKPEWHDWKFSRNRFSQMPNFDVRTIYRAWADGGTALAELIPSRTQKGFYLFLWTGDCLDYFQGPCIFDRLGDDGTHKSFIGEMCDFLWALDVKLDAPELGDWHTVDEALLPDFLEDGSAFWDGVPEGLSDDECYEWFADHRDDGRLTQGKADLMLEAAA